MDGPLFSGCNLGSFQASAGGLSSDHGAEFLRRQVEFYFSDSNLLVDTFLQRQIWRTRKGYVRLGLLAKFNRVRGALDAMKVPGGERIETLAGALESSKLLKLNVLRNQVKRIERFRILEVGSEKNRTKRERRTLYFEGLGTQASSDSLHARLQNFGTIARLRLPKYRDGQTKGWATVEFIDENSANDFLAASRKHSLGFSIISAAEFRQNCKIFEAERSAILAELGYTPKPATDLASCFFFKPKVLPRAGATRIFSALRQLQISARPISGGSIIAVSDPAQANLLLKYSASLPAELSFIEELEPVKEVEKKEILRRLTSPPPRKAIRKLAPQTHRRKENNRKN